MITNTIDQATRKLNLVWLAPGALALFLYASFVALPVQGTLSDLQSRKNAAKASAVMESEAVQARQRLRQTQTSVQELNHQIEENRYLIASMGQSMRAPDARLETAQLVTEILQQFNLSINHQSFESTPALSEYMSELNRKIDEHCADSPLEFWEIEVAGQYTDVISFLREVRLSGMRTFPILVSMEASSQDGFHTWKILFVV